MPTTVAVLGDGAWGTAMALVLDRQPGVRVRLWSARAENGTALQQARENVRFLPGVPLPSTLELTTSAEEAVSGCDYWVSAIPTVHLRNTLTRFQAWATPNTPVISLTKGLEISTFRRPSEIIHEILGTDRVVALSGPTHAEEVARSRPTSAVAAGTESALASAVQRLFNSDRFRVYTNSDLLGVEIAGALKNVMGIAAGINDGLGYGDNAKSALLTRGLVEMTRFGIAHGAEPQTFQGLAGVGDLITTCFSRHGRNRRVGELLGKGQTLAEILGNTPAVVEGVTTAKSVHERTVRLGLEMPISTAVYRVLYEGVSPEEGVITLMNRKTGGERL